MLTHALKCYPLVYKKKPLMHLSFHYRQGFLLFTKLILKIENMNICQRNYFSLVKLCSKNNLSKFVKHYKSLAITCGQL